MPLIVHESTGDPATAGGERYGGMMRPESYVFHHVISHPFEQMMAMMALICGGVLERHPTLKVGFFEAGCSWAPYWIARLDDHFEHPRLGGYMRELTMRPSAYFERQCVVTCDPRRPHDPARRRGPRRAQDPVRDRLPAFRFRRRPGPGIPRGAKLEPGDARRILRDNALDFYGLSA